MADSQEALTTGDKSRTSKYKERYVQKVGALKHDGEHSHAAVICGRITSLLCWLSAAHSCQIHDSACHFVSRNNDFMLHQKMYCDFTGAIFLLKPIENALVQMLFY